MIIAVGLLSVVGLLTYQVGISLAHPATPSRSFSPLLAGKSAASFFVPGPKPPTNAQCLAGSPTQTALPCVSPQELRVAYNVKPLLDAGLTGKGQTIVIFDPIGSPTIKQDLVKYDAGYHLPDPPSFQVLTPLGTPTYDVNNIDDQSWAIETSIDVEMSHAMAPDANIVLVLSTVDETQGLQGMPELYQAEKFAFDNHLGNIWLQCFGTTETTLQDPTQAIDPNTHKNVFAEFENLYAQAAQQHISVFATAGDFGTGNPGLDGKTVPMPTVNFPASSPLVTAVGGTSLKVDGHGNYKSETVWNNPGDRNGRATGGGLSAQFKEPLYQDVLLPDSDQKLLKGNRGLPDISYNADVLSAAMLTFMSSLGGPATAGWYFNGGTSSGAPQLAGIIADADQMAGHPLGFLNPDLYVLGALSEGNVHANPQLTSILHELRQVVDTDNVYHDITVGNNGGIGGVAGFNATPGWDLTTGWGSPNAAKLVQALLQVDQVLGSQDPLQFV